MAAAGERAGAKKGAEGWAAAVKTEGWSGASEGRRLQAGTRGSSVCGILISDIPETTDHPTILPPRRHPRAELAPLAPATVLTLELPDASIRRAIAVIHICACGSVRNRSIFHRWMISRVVYDNGEREPRRNVINVPSHSFLFRPAPTFGLVRFPGSICEEILSSL